MFVPRYPLHLPFFLVQSIMWAVMLCVTQEGLDFYFYSATYKSELSSWCLLTKGHNLACATISRTQAPGLSENYEVMSQHQSLVVRGFRMQEMGINTNFRNSEPRFFYMCTFCCPTALTHSMWNVAVKIVLQHIVGSSNYLWLK